MVVHIILIIALFIGFGSPAPSRTVMGSQESQTPSKAWLEALSARRQAGGELRFYVKCNLIGQIDQGDMKAHVFALKAKFET